MGREHRKAYTIPSAHEIADTTPLGLEVATQIAFPDATTAGLHAAGLNAQALRLRRLGLSYKEVARIMGSISPERARLRALAGLRAEAIRQGKRYYHLRHDTYLNRL